MFIRTLEAIKNKPMINLFAMVLLSLVFGVQLMVFSWADSVFGAINDSYSDDQLMSYRVVFIGLLIVSVSSVITIINYILTKRKSEFDCYKVCGADSVCIFLQKSVHVFLIVIAAELIGSIMFYLSMLMLQMKFDLLALYYVYIIFVVVVFLEIAIKHFVLKESKVNARYSRVD